MKSLTTDRTNPDLGHGSDKNPVEQNKVYLVLSDEEIAKGYVKPYRESYKHLTCGGITTMNGTIASTYARDPYFYGATYCCNCGMHRPLEEFIWLPDGESMSPRLQDEDDRE